MNARIAITPWTRQVGTAPGHAMVLHTLDPAYVEFVSASGGLSLIVPRGAEVGAVLDMVDGLLLTGGNDIDPTLYGAVNDGSSVHVDPEADRWELNLLLGARERGMPVLAICRGMQLMAVAFGGCLEQEIARLALPDHPRLASLTQEEIYALRHEIRIAPSSRLAAIACTLGATVNSLHHQAVVDPGKLKVSARTPTGVIEAVEPQDDWPAIGVQWHPEKLQEDLSRRLFAHLVREAANYRERRRGR